MDRGELYDKWVQEGEYLYTLSEEELFMFWCFVMEAEER